MFLRKGSKMALWNFIKGIYLDWIWKEEQKRKIHTRIQGKNCIKIVPDLRNYPKKMSKNNRKVFLRELRSWRDA